MMSSELAIALISLVSGGGLTALAKIFIDSGQARQAARDKTIDERIIAWQKISERNETRLEQLEKKLELYDRDFRSLERYVLALERIIVKEVPAAKLRERPVLEREAAAL